VIALDILGGVFGDTPDPDGQLHRGVGPMTYYVPAHIGLVIASMGLIGLPAHLAAYRRPRSSTTPSPRVADVTPLKHVILTLQDPWLGFGSTPPNCWWSPGVLVLWALLALRLFRWQ
jgi:hypothetical protein